MVKGGKAIENKRHINRVFLKSWVFTCHWVNIHSLCLCRMAHIPRTYKDCNSCMDFVYSFRICFKDESYIHPEGSYNFNVQTNLDPK